MGKGFDLFMRNPYYRQMYENAPTERLKQCLKREWDESPFVTGDVSALEAVEPTTSTKLDKNEVEYLAKFAVGGAEKAFYKKWLSQFDKQ